MNAVAARQLQSGIAAQHTHAITDVFSSSDESALSTTRSNPGIFGALRGTNNSFSLLSIPLKARLHRKTPLFLTRGDSNPIGSTNSLLFSNEIHAKANPV